MPFKTDGRPENSKRASISIKNFTPRFVALTVAIKMKTYLSQVAKILKMRFFPKLKSSTWIRKSQHAPLILVWNLFPQKISIAWTKMANSSLSPGQTTAQQRSKSMHCGVPQSSSTNSEEMLQIQLKQFWLRSLTLRTVQYAITDLDTFTSTRETKKSQNSYNIHDASAKLEKAPK